MKVKELAKLLERIMKENPAVAEAEVTTMQDSELIKVNGFQIQRSLKAIVLTDNGLVQPYDSKEGVVVSYVDGDGELCKSRERRSQLAPLGIPASWLKNPFEPLTKPTFSLGLTEAQREAMAAMKADRTSHEELYRQEVDRRMREEERRILAHRLDGFPGEQRQQLIEVFMHMSEHRRSKLKD